MFTFTRSFELIALGLLLLVSHAAAAADHAAIAPYLTDDVDGVGCLDLTRIDLPKIVDELLRVGIIPEAAQAEARRDAATLQAEASGLRQLGVRRAYVLFRVNDVVEGTMTWVVEVERGGNAAETARLLNKHRQAFMSPAGTPASMLRDFLLPREFSAINETIVAAGTERQLAGVKELAGQSRRTPREDAMAALAGLGDADAGLAIIGDADSRRVVREMLPPLPAPLAAIDGKLLADDLRWAGVAVKFPPKFELAITADATTPEVAQTLEQAVSNSMALAKGLLLKEIVQGPSTHRERAKGLLPLLSLVAPRVEGTRLTITFGDDADEVAFMRDFLPALTQSMRTAAYHTSRMHRFKQVGLGLANYDSARKQYPAAASRDADGRPLLSWRVQILPYMEHVDLWKQFKLDEPWDSEHNRKLIDRMPDMYADPDPDVRAAIGDRGRTTCLAPIAAGTVFGGRDGIKYSDMKDGGSNTVMALEVVPERAVVWTKPDDWEIDVANPLNGVKRNDRDGFVAAWGDGHASIITNDVDAKQFLGDLTYAGGEATKGE
jgi:hypothetical protein